MDLSVPLAWLVDEAGDSPGADRFLADLGCRLLADGLPLVGGALTLAVPQYASRGERREALASVFSTLAMPVATGRTLGHRDSGLSYPRIDRRGRPRHRRGGLCRERLVGG